MNILMIAMYEQLKAEIAHCNERANNFRAVLHPNYQSLCIHFYGEGEFDSEYLEIYLKEDFSIAEVCRNDGEQEISSEEKQFFDEKNRPEVHKLVELFDRWTNELCCE